MIYIYGQWLTQENEIMDANILYCNDRRASWFNSNASHVLHQLLNLNAADRYADENQTALQKV